MSNKALRLAEYLGHIHEAIMRIQSYVESLNEQEFISNTMVQDAVLRNLEIIGEASHNIDKHFPEFVEKHSDIPFLYAYEMRNAISHGYFKVDLVIVWQTVCNDLPGLSQAIEQVRLEVMGS